MGSCLRTEDRLRSASRRVNGYSRNPDVLPTFLHVIPKRRRHHPQFFPMVNVSRRHPGAVAMGVAAMVAALALAGVVGLGDSSARAQEAGVSPVLYLSTGALGAATGNDALGLRTPYYEPPALSDPAQPGFTVNSGADQPDPFMYQEGGRYSLFTSQDRVPTNVPVRSGTVVGRWGTPTDALPDPPAWPEPGVMWSPDVARFGDHYILYFSTMVRNVSPGLMCIGDAISTAVGGPYIASPVPFICQPTLGGSIDPRVFRRLHRSALHDLEVGAERAFVHRQHPDLEPAAQRRRHAPRGGADGDPAPTTCSTRVGGSTSPGTPSAWPAAPARSGRAPTCPPRRCWPPTPRVRVREGSPCSPTRPLSGLYTPSRSTRLLPDRPAPSPWPTSAPGPRGPTSPRPFAVSGPA